MKMDTQSFQVCRSTLAIFVENQNTIALVIKTFASPLGLVRFSLNFRTFLQIEFIMFEVDDLI